MAAETVYGFHAVEVLLRRAPERVLSVYLDKTRADARARALRALAQRMGVAVHGCDARTLARRAPRAAHQGVLAEVRPVREYDERDLTGLLDTGGDAPLLLVLDGVQDPHNLGACLRTAEAAGADAVILPRDRTCPLTAAVRKAAAGAADVIPVFRVANLARVLTRLKAAGVWIVGTAEDAPDSVFDTDLNGPLALVLGGEQSGLRRLTSERCDALVAIPTAGSNSALNVSVASGICLFEALRQRRTVADGARRRGT